MYLLPLLMVFYGALFSPVMMLLGPVRYESIQNLV